MSMIECVSKCCIFEKCDIAYMEGDVCYNQVCTTLENCLIFDNNNALSSLTYIVRNPFEQSCF